MVCILILIFITRFNKIAIQLTPQMAVDKEAISLISSVYSYYSKCNLPLLYVNHALTIYLSILFLNILKRPGIEFGVVWIDSVIVVWIDSAMLQLLLTRRVNY